MPYEMHGPEDHHGADARQHHVSEDRAPLHSPGICKNVPVLHLVHWWLRPSGATII
jgi:hypothetical protein